MEKPSHGGGHMSSPFLNTWVLVRGGGDLVSGPIQRLRWAGFPVLVAELPEPRVVRRLVSFANAVYEGTCEVEGTTARLVSTLQEARDFIAAAPEGVPVMIDPHARAIRELMPTILLDGRMLKGPSDTRLDHAPVVIGMGPGFIAGVDVHAVVETKGGSQCGRVYYHGGAIEDTGIPCLSSGYRQERVLRAPASGTFEACREIGEMVEARETVGWIQTAAGRVPVKAQISGLLRGLLHSGVAVDAQVKVGDIDHRGESSDCCRVSEKADSVAAGVLEAILRLSVQRRIDLTCPLAPLTSV